MLSDFDGTLVPLADRPGAVELPAATRRLLAALAALPRAAAGVVSGRSVRDVAGRVGLRGLWYVGSHGYEIIAPSGEERRFYEPADVSFMDGVGREMEGETSSVRGARLERKGPVLAVHHRQVDPSEVPRLERAFLEVVGRHHPRLMVSRGIQVLEVRPRGSCNKGRAVGMIRRELPTGTLVLYFGDDLTDRDAFRELRGVGVSVEVGARDSGLTDFTLPDPPAVGTVLRRIVDLLGGKPGGSRPRGGPPGRKRR